MLGIQTRHPRDDAFVAVQNQQDVSRSDVAGVFHPAQRRQLEGGAAILRIARVVEVDRPTILLLGHVLEVGVPLGHGAVDGRLVFWVKAEGLRKAAVLSAIDFSLRHQRDEVVLHRLGIVLPGEGGGRLACAAESHDQDDPLRLANRDDFAAGVHGETAGVIDLLVPHAEPALLRLTEVIGVEDPRDARFEVDKNRPVARVARRGEVRRVDHRDFRLSATVRGVVEMPLHAGNVGVARLDEEPGRGPEGRVVTDDAIEQHHLLVADVLVLELRPFPAFLRRHGLRRMLLRSVGDDVRALGAA